MRKRLPVANSFSAGCIERVIIEILNSLCMNRATDEDDKSRTLPICFNAEQLALLEEFAKKKGMTSYSQAVEFVATQRNHHQHFPYLNSREAKTIGYSLMDLV